MMVVEVSSLRFAENNHPSAHNKSMSQTPMDSCSVSDVQVQSVRHLRGPYTPEKRTLPPPYPEVTIP
jgi:hypothetical protein